MNYKSLDSDKIVSTVEALQKRIDERFPGFGISKACGQLLDISRLARNRSLWIGKPILSLRLGIGFLLIVIVAGACTTLLSLQMPAQKFDFPQFIQVLEAGINDVVFIGIAIFFLMSLETRIKRRRALKAIHELRALAHIIDMHQLTKDPERVIASGGDTASSPQRKMRPFELRRYLDYCSEMLSLIGKIAALYVQNFDDNVVPASVNEVEALTTGLSRKIWQKISIQHLLTQPDMNKKKMEEL